MSLEQLSQYWPILAIVAGAVLLLWGQRDRLKAWVAGLRPAPVAESEMTPAARFETFYAMRSWCETAGHTEAVHALDTVILPTIVRGPAPNEGGPSS